MKICVPSTGKDLKGEVSSRFGRCNYFIFIDSDTLKYEAVKNPNAYVGGGAGVSSAQLVISKGAEIILAKNIGPKAMSVLQSAGIRVIVGITGTIEEVIKII